MAAANMAQVQIRLGDDAAARRLLVEAFTMSADRAARRR